MLYVNGKADLYLRPFFEDELHIAQKKNGKSVDGRTTRHEGYAVSQRTRKRVEEIFGWAKTVGLVRKAKMRGRRKVDWLFTLSIAVFNLVRMRNMEALA